MAYGRFGRNTIDVTHSHLSPGWICLVNILITPSDSNRLFPSLFQSLFQSLFRSLFPALALIWFRYRWIPFVNVYSFIKYPEMALPAIWLQLFAVFHPKMFPIWKSISNWIFEISWNYLVFSTMAIHSVNTRHEHTKTRTHIERTAWKRRINKNPAQNQQKYRRCWRWCDDSLIFIYCWCSFFIHIIYSTSSRFHECCRRCCKFAFWCSFSPIHAIHPSVQNVWIISHYFHSMIRRFFGTKVIFPCVTFSHNL